jgi:hypothetical protein
MVGEPLPQILGQVCHLGKVCDVPVIDPPENLASPISREVMFFQPRYKGLIAEVLNVFKVAHSKKALNSFLFR